MTVSDVLDQILLRLDDEEDINSVELIKSKSRVDVTESNQLLSSVIQKFILELEELV
jgi:hypothetical protein